MTNYDQQIDLLLATALTEEAQVVSAVLDLVATALPITATGRGDRRQLVRLYDYPVGDGRVCRVAAASAHHMGAVGMGVFAAPLLSQLGPRTAALIGIAAAVDATAVELGDVPFASQVLSYDDIAVENGVLTFRSEGFQVDPEMSAAVGELRTSVTSYRPWQKECSAIIKKVVGILNQLRPTTMTLQRPTRPPHLVVDVSAGGPFLLRDKDFRESLRRSLPSHQGIKVAHPLHPKLVSAEMESHGFMRAAHRYHVPTSVLKGISDVGDAKKAKLEKETGGFFRAYACTNAVLAALHILKSRSITDPDMGRVGPPSGVPSNFSHSGSVRSHALSAMDEARTRTPFGAQNDSELSVADATSDVSVSNATISSGLSASTPSGSQVASVQPVDRRQASPEVARSLIKRENLSEHITRALSLEKFCWLYGIHGIGKTTLANQAIELADAFATRKVIIDCRSEVHAHGTLANAILYAFGVEPPENKLFAFRKLKEAVAERVGDTLVVLDELDAFTPGAARSALNLILSSKLHAIIISSQVPDVFDSVGTKRERISSPIPLTLVEVYPFEEAESLSYLQQRGIAPQVARQVQQLSGGNPTLLATLTDMVVNSGGIESVFGARGRVHWSSIVRYFSKLWGSLAKDDRVDLIFRSVVLAHVKQGTSFGALQTRTAGYIYERFLRDDMVSPLFVMWIIHECAQDFLREGRRRKKYFGASPQVWAEAVHYLQQQNRESLVSSLIAGA